MRFKRHASLCGIPETHSQDKQQDQNVSFSCFDKGCVDLRSQSLGLSGISSAFQTKISQEVEHCT